MYTYDDLWEKTVKDLKVICKKYGIIGYSHKTKQEIVDLIHDFQSGDKEKETTPTANMNEIQGIEGNFSSRLTNPKNSIGNRHTTTVQVSCGANTNRFNVVGRTLTEISKALKEILNISDFSTPLVNGKNREWDYVVKEKDVIEFLKPAGVKGI